MGWVSNLNLSISAIATPFNPWLVSPSKPPNWLHEELSDIVAQPSLWAGYSFSRTIIASCEDQV